MTDQLDPHRRSCLQGLAAIGGLGLGGCAGGGATGALDTAMRDRVATLAPLRARPEGIVDVTVCLRPFRAAGPRLETEQVGDARVVHNYGHGGSGWSLSWGSAEVAVRKAMEHSPRNVAVIGCGALGITSARVAQAAGAQVTIYAREPLHEAPSMRAAGAFTPDSRIALAEAADRSFPDLWEQMARSSFRRLGAYAGLPGKPVRWIDRYFVADHPLPAHPVPELPERDQPHFAAYFSRLGDLFAPIETLEPADTPFRAASVRRQRTIMFDIATYARTLMTEFRLAGGRFERREFHGPAELARLPEKVIIDCTGYGARALWRDDTVVPVRGQIAWLEPQREFDYGLLYRGVSVVPRSDAIGVQRVGGTDRSGFGDADSAPDRHEAETAVGVLRELYANFGARSAVRASVRRPG